MPQWNLTGPLLFGADEFVCQMVKAKFPQIRDREFARYAAIGVVRNGVLLGGIILSDWTGHDIALTGAFDKANWITPALCRQLAHHIFDTFGVARVSMSVSRKNKRMRRLAIGLGFKLEGVKAHGFDGKIDAVLYGTTRKDCRWLKDIEHADTRASDAA